MCKPRLAGKNDDFGRQATLMRALKLPLMSSVIIAMMQEQPKEASTVTESEVMISLESRRVDQYQCEGLTDVWSARDGLGNGEPSTQNAQ